MADRAMTAGPLRIGIDLGGTKISGVVMSPGGDVVASRRVPSPRGDYPATLQATTGLVALLEGAVGSGPGSCRIGIGTPGTWQAASRTMKNCNSTWLNGRPLLDDLVARLGARVRIANDADCFALSEASDGAGQGFAAVFGAILGTGVGGGVVLGGTLLRGRRGLTGEWGHTPLPYLRSWPFANPARGPARRVEAELFQLESSLSDRICYCGRLNCIETFLSGPGLAASHQALWQETRSPRQIAGGATERERLTLGLYAEMLARSLAQVVNLLDPDVIVLGGGISNIGGLYELVAGRLPRYLFAADPGSHGAAEAPAVRPARWGDDSGVRGAAWLWPPDGHGQHRPQARING